MSYTMTMDMPTKESAYVKRRGPRFQAQLKSLVIAFVTTEMQRDAFEWSDDRSNETSEESGEDILDQLSGIAKLPPGFDDKSIRAEAALEKYDGISPRVKSLRGTVSLPPDFDEEEFKAARLVEKTKLDFVADWGRFQVQEGELNLSRTNESLREVDFG